MDEPLFIVKPECGVPYVPKVNLTFVEDCVIPPLPPPIFDCEPPIPPPPEPPIPCPDISGSVSIVVRPDGSRCGTSASSLDSDGGGVMTITRTEFCEFNIDLALDIVIPSVPCPVFRPSQLTVVTGRIGCIPSSSDSLTITATPCGDTNDPNAPCEFELELNLTIPIPPCPSITTLPPIITTTRPYCFGFNEPSTLTVSSSQPCGDPNEPCAFEFAINLNIPVPPCPIFHWRTPTLAYSRKSDLVCPPSSSSSDSVTVEVPSDPCNPLEPCETIFGLHLNIEWPVCPKIKAREEELILTPGVKLTRGRVGCNFPSSSDSLTITASEQCDPRQPCEFEFALHLTIPEPPCPRITTKPPVVNIIRKQCSSSSQLDGITITAIPQCDLNEPCEFELEVNLTIPVPPCPKIKTNPPTVTTTRCAGPGGGVFTVIEPPECGDPDDPCEFELDLQISVPVPPCPVILTRPPDVWVFEPTCVGGRPISVLTATPLNNPCGPAEEPCGILLDLEIAIPLPPCPDITGQVYVLVGDPAKSTLEVTNNTLKGCFRDPAEPCDYTIDVTVYVPPFECPVFTIYTPPKVHFSSGENSLKIQLKVPPPPDPNADPPIVVYDCEYEVSLDIYVPLACPVFTVNTTTVSVGDPAESALTIKAAEGSTPEACAFDVDLVINIPCPIFNVLPITVAVGDPSSSTFTIAPVVVTAGDPCKFDVTLGLYIPDFACPVFNVLPITITAGPVASSVFTITPVAATAEDPCKFDVTLGLYMPTLCVWTYELDVATVANGRLTIGLTGETWEPVIDTSECSVVFEQTRAVPPPPTFTSASGSGVTWLAECDAAPTVNITITPTYATAVAWPLNTVVASYEVLFDLRLPRPVVYTGGAITVGDYGSGTISVVPNGPTCDRLITAAITLDTTPCAPPGSSSAPFTVMPPGYYDIEETPPAPLSDDEESDIFIARVLNELATNLEFRKIIRQIVTKDAD